MRLYIAPHLGPKRLDKLTVRDVREWLTKLSGICRCCAQGKDAKRAPGSRRCCAAGECCEAHPSRRVVQAARDALRAALTHAVTEEEIGKNVAALVKVPKPRRRRIKPWSAWKSVDFEAGELYVDHQIQRAGRQILHRETKTEESDDFLPLPALCLKPLRVRRAQQTGDRKAAGDLWQDSHDLIFTTKYGTPIEPGNLTRMFALRARRAGLRVIPLRNTRHTCAALLVLLKVHPRVAQRILRHSQIAMTMEVYAEADDAAVREALAMLSGAMGGAG
ncbi:putative phage integrase [Streptomyces noursei]|nr:putative phage integrase [Streptomyces noursei]